MSNARRLTWTLVVVGALTTSCVALPWLVVQNQGRFPNFPPGFCALSGGRFLYTDDGDGGKDLFVFDTKTRTRKRVARTPYREGEVAVSPDGKTAVCTFGVANPTGDGLLLIDLASGKTRILTRDDAAFPVFSPSGRRIAFGRAGSVSITLNSVKEVWEYDLQTERSGKITSARYYAVGSPAYRSEDRMYFTGGLVIGDDGTNKTVITEFVRGSPAPRIQTLPEWASLGILGFSADGKRFYGVGSGKYQEDNHIVWGSVDAMVTPAKWTRSKVRTGGGSLAPSRKEVLYPSENQNYHFVCGLTLADGKTRTYLKLPK